MRRLCAYVYVGMPLIIALLLGPAGAVYADAVRLKNGDHLTGTILSLTERDLHLRTSYAGELSIRREEVIVLQTERPMVVVFMGGQQHIGWLDLTDEGGNFLLTRSGPIFFRLEDIATLQPLTAEEARRTALASRPPLWKHHLEFGAQVRSGNTDAMDITSQFQSRRIARASELQTSVAADFGMTEGERTAQRVLGVGRLDLHRTPRLFSFGQVSLEHDDLKKLVLRAQEQAGVGYKFILTPRTLLQGTIGAGLQEELFEGEDVAVEPLGRLGIEWTQRLGRASELAGQVTFLPNLIDLGEYRLEGEASLSTPITHRFHLRFSLTDTFDSAPQPGVEQNDLTLLSSVVWSF